MPAFVGPIHFVTVSGGVVQFGDAAVISPKSNSKTNSGSGGGNTGAIIVATNGVSGTNVLDNKLLDQPSIGNN